MLADAGGAEGVARRADGDEELVVRDVELGRGALDRGLVATAHDLPRRVDVDRGGFEKTRLAGFPGKEPAHRLDERPRLDRADGDPGEEGRVEEVVARGDHADVVQRGVDLLQASHRAPPGAEDEEPRGGGGVRVRHGEETGARKGAPRGRRTPPRPPRRRTARTEPGPPSASERRKRRGLRPGRATDVTRRETRDSDEAPMRRSTLRPRFARARARVCRLHHRVVSSSSKFSRECTLHDAS